MSEPENVQPARKGADLLLNVLRRVHRGELTPEEGAQILARSPDQGRRERSG